MRGRRAGQGRGRLPGGIKLDAAYGHGGPLANPLERIRYGSVREGALHADGVEIQTQPTLAGGAVDADPDGFPARAIQWTRGDNGQRVGYIHVHGAPAPLAVYDFNQMQLIAEHYDDGYEGKAKFELNVTDQSADIRAYVEQSNLGPGSGNRVLLNAQNKSAYIFDKNQGSHLTDGHIWGTACEWMANVVNDGWFRFYPAAATNVHHDTQNASGLGNGYDGNITLYCRKTGVYLVTLSVHTHNSVGALQVYGFKNSVTAIPGLRAGWPINASHYYGLDNIGVGNGTAVVLPLTVNDNIRFGGWFVNGGTVYIVASMSRLPI